MLPVRGAGFRVVLMDGVKLLWLPNVMNPIDRIFHFSRIFEEISSSILPLCRDGA